MLDPQAIAAAHGAIAPYVYRSPCAYSLQLSRDTGLELYLKLENLQMTGSFKERGALHRLLQLSAAQRRCGVITASAGNHAQGLAYHAARLGVAATVCMPVRTPLVKVTATQKHGAQVILHGQDYDDACAHAQHLARARGHVFVHPFDDPAVIAGQGTVAVELLAQLPALDAVIAPIGGGGLLGGMALWLKHHRPQVRVIGVQSERLPSAVQAIGAGQPLTVPPSRTLADGIAVRRVGRQTLPLLQRYVDAVALVSEEAIAAAILRLLEGEKTVAEGAGATALAAVLSGKVELPPGSRTVVLVCGGNIDVNLLGRIIDRGLVLDGRRLRLRLQLADDPGALHAALATVATEGANILDVVHHRAFASVDLASTAVDLTLELRDAAHGQSLVHALRARGQEVTPLSAFA
ncbi:MAG: threonine ammonia-lyase [Polyangiales bacterium]